MAGPLTFVLDEHVFIWSMTLTQVEYRSGRYVRGLGEERRALELLSLIETEDHSLGLSLDLWQRYQGHHAGIRRGRLMAGSIDPFGVVRRLWNQDRVHFEGHPARAKVPRDFPGRDRHLVDIAAAVGAVIVAEDPRVLQSLSLGDPVEAVGLDQAIRVARATP